MPRLTDILPALRHAMERHAPVAGDRLPAERDLAAELGCSRQTLRAGLAILEQDAEIWRHVGQGTFRGPRPLGHPVRESLLIEVRSPAQIMRARLLIEPPIAAEAARTAGAAERRYLSMLADDARAATTRAACEQADARFHRGIAEVADNPILLGVLDHLSGARRRAVWQREWDRTYRQVGVAEFTGPHSDQHTAIVDAIAAADAQRAQSAMRSHLETIERAMRLAEAVVGRETRG
ncbi:transcriptional regulator, GntR family [Gemmobacter megaterium]|uniref:Transcriptional regulator, GntR family n=1 Tax=Gemmobacter megaterium TaxID=1086013 RepID=A0A1N7QNT0_9RHOB|nr:FCD domain-containing protein [Gemmobacter megaterium]GGE28097.1 GntR family transcriptional regulator [Gemmobacter megaterium]SIT24478.1 transcriptional regulator, GntR family [Gemmobacter megaterium]